MEGFKNRKWVVFILSILLLFDLSVNAVQYYNQPFDSDIVESVLPLPYMEPLMESLTASRNPFNPNKNIFSALSQSYGLELKVGAMAMQPKLCYYFGEIPNDKLFFETSF